VDSLFSKAAKKSKKKKSSSSSGKEKGRGGTVRRVTMWTPPKWSLNPIFCCLLTTSLSQASSAGSRKKLLKDGLSQSGKQYGDDLDLLESATVGAGDEDECDDDNEDGGGSAKYLMSATAGPGMTRPGAGAVGAGSGGKAQSRGGAAGGGGTIVKAEFQDVFFRQETPDGDANNLNLAKVSVLWCRAVLV
jgi:hypothetical protein